MEMALIAGEQVLVMFMLLLLGYVLFRLKMLKEDGVGQMNRLLLVVVNPLLMLSSFNRAYDAALFADIGRCFLLFIISNIIAAVVAFIVVRKKGNDDRVERFAMCFSNCGFMGMPLVEAVLGTEAVIFAAVGVAVFNLWQWTLGRIILVGAGRPLETAKKILLSPGIIGVTAGILLFMSPWTLPSPLARTAEFMGRMNTPLAMLIVGTFIAKLKLGDFFRSLRTYRTAIVRLLVVPALMLPIYALLPMPRDVMLANYLLTCCPVAAVAAMFPVMLGLEGGGKGSGYVAVSTLLSVVTIPLMVALV